MSTKKILIIDDDPSVGEVIELYLEDLAAVETIFTTSPEEALKILKDQQIHLVITDIIMPDINGIDLAQHIRQAYPAVKVLVYSGGGESGDIFAGVAVDTALDKGAHDGILKPFSKEELLEVVTPILEG